MSRRESGAPETPDRKPRPVRDEVSAGRGFFPEIGRIAAVARGGSTPAAGGRMTAGVGRRKNLGIPKK
jgi:hypothetical protein